jgi:VanZ family protein
MDRLLKYWLPVIAWMALIFIASSDLGSAAHTSRFVEPFLRWLKPGISQTAIERVHFLIRKGGHLTVYAVLAIFLRRACAQSGRTVADAWRWRDALLAWSLAVAYAASDEFHQSFVPSRGASVHDVLIDGCGAAIGLLIAWAWLCRRRASENVDGEARLS